MTKRRLRIAKIFIAINMIIIIVLSAVAFYGENIKHYSGVSTNGIDDQKTFFDLLKLMYFSGVEDYTNTSLKILSEGRHVYDNYCLQADIEFGDPPLIGDNGIRNEQCELNITTYIDGDKSEGFIRFKRIGLENPPEYKYYRVCNDGVVTTYLRVDDVWYVTKEAGEHVALDMNGIIEQLKNANYESYPNRELGETKATLYLKDHDVCRVNICGCKEIGSISYHNGDADTFADVVKKATGSTYDEYVKIISDWVKTNDCEIGVLFSIDSIDKIDVDVPENIDQIAVEGDVYEIIMKMFANIAINKKDT